MKFTIISDLEVGPATIKEIERLGMTLDEAIQIWVANPPARAALVGEERIQARIELAFGFRAGLKKVERG